MARCDCCDKREKEEFQPLPVSILEVEDYIAASSGLHDQELPIPDEDDRCVRTFFRIASSIRPTEHYNHLFIFHQN